MGVFVLLFTIITGMLCYDRQARRLLFVNDLGKAVSYAQKTADWTGRSGSFRSSRAPLFVQTVQELALLREGWASRHSRCSLILYGDVGPLARAPSLYQSFHERFIALTTEHIFS